MNPIILIPIGAAALLVFVVISLMGVASKLLQKVGPNEAMIISGWGGLKIVTGGAALVVPLFQKAQLFSLESTPFDLAQSLFTIQGIAVNVEANTLIKVRADEASIKTAAEQFLSKSHQDRQNLIRQVMEGQLRGIVGQLTIETLVTDPQSVSTRMRENVLADMQRMGLEVVSFTIRNVRDGNDYIKNMALPKIVEKRRDAELAAVEAERVTKIKRAEATLAAAIAEAQANEKRVKVESESLALQAEAQRNLALRKAEFDAEVKRQQVIAEKASDIQANITQQEVVSAQITVQEAEIKRRRLELEATTLRAAEAERDRLILEAEGQAKAIRTRGIAEADVVRARGQGEAEAIRAKGEAEAETMKLKAVAFNEYNQAAVVDKFLTNMPEVLRAMAEPLNKIKGVTIVSTGSSDGGSNGNGTGISRLTNDMVEMTAQVSALFEGFTGIRIGDLVSSMRALPSKDNVSVNGAKPTTDNEQAS